VAFDAMRANRAIVSIGRYVVTLPTLPEFEAVAGR
jgi:hypothetical protein